MRTLLAHCREEGVGSRELGDRRVVAFPVFAAAVERVLDLCDELERDESVMIYRFAGELVASVRAALLGGEAPQ